MNPMGIFLIAVGVVMIIIAITGKQHDVVAALTNKPAKTS